MVTSESCDSGICRDRAPGHQHPCFRGRFCVVPTIRYQPACRRFDCRIRLGQLGAIGNLSDISAIVLLSGFDLNRSLSAVRDQGIRTYVDSPSDTKGLTSNPDSRTTESRPPPAHFQAATLDRAEYRSDTQPSREAQRNAGVAWRLRDVTKPSAYLPYLTAPSISARRTPNAPARASGYSPP